MPEPSILDARLAEIDRRLRMIQSGLEPVRDTTDDPLAEHPTARAAVRAPGTPGGTTTHASPAPSPGPPASLIARRLAPPPTPADPRDAEIAVLTDRLIELTATHERLLATAQGLMAEQADALARATPTVSVSAGPFADTRALQEFQHAVSELPQVREVAIREYVGSEGVILDVHLGSPIS